MLDKNKEVKELTNLLVATSRLIKTKLKEQTETHGAISFAQYKTLCFINGHSRPTMKELADYLSITPPSATSLTDHFVQNDVIKRVLDESDRRIVRLEITAKGKKILEEGFKAIHEKMQQVLLVLDRQQIANLKDILETLDKHYKF